MTEGAAQPYPVMLNVAGRLAIVVGAGSPAVRAAKVLSAHGADVVVISPEPTSELVDMEADGAISIEAREFAAGDLEGAFVAVAASGVAATDAAVAAEARSRGALVNSPGDAAASDFVVPSVVKRGALQIAVTTGGGAPYLAREVRRGIAKEYGPEWEAYTALVSDLRTLAIERTHLGDAELVPLFDAVDGPEVRRLLAAGRTFTAKELFEEHEAALVAPSDEDVTP